MYSGNVTEQIEGIRRQTVAVLDDLIGKAGGFELAAPPPALKRSRRGLIRDGHEAKGGHD
jgi:hypothetical protein